MAHLKMPMASDTLASRNNTWEQANLRAVEIARSEGNDDFSSQSYPTLQAQRKDAASGQASKGIRYLTVAVNHLDAMESAVMSLPNNGDIRLFNKLFAGVANQVNDSNVAVEQVDATVVGNEVAKAISGAGNLTGEERQQLAAMFDPSRSKESLLEIIHAVKSLLAGQVAGYTTQFGHYTSAADVTGIPVETMKKLFIDPSTGQIAEPLVQWDRQRAKAVLTGQPAPPMPDLPRAAKGGQPAQSGAPAAPAPPAAGTAPAAAPGYSPGQTAGKEAIAHAADGRPVFWRGGKFVYEDGSPWTEK
jgi:hypothetical protein